MKLLEKLPSLERLGRIGLVGERKATALLCLGFYTSLFALIAILAGLQMPELMPLYIAMGVIYGVAFFAVAAEWFWGRWFATGLAYWGCTMTGWAIVSLRALPTPLIIFGATHAIIAGCLFGERMAALFDAKPKWRERWKLDEAGVLRLRKSVTRAASSLPALVMFALAPRQDGQGLGWMHSVLPVPLDGAAVLFGLLAAVSLWSLLRTQRTLALLGLGAAGTGLVALALITPAFVTMQPLFVPDLPGPLGMLSAPLTQAVTPVELSAEAFRLLGLWAGGALLFACLPFARPMARFLASRRV